MSFTLTSPDSSVPNPSTDEETLSSALHAALSSLTPPHSEQDTAMKQDSQKSRLEIVLNSDCLSLKGTGVDVAPALLSGHVALYLTESTSFKEITLQFRGKSRLPPPASEQLAINTAPVTYIVCNHDWSFLEGHKRHSHTLKAGRHIFPFQLQIGGSLPSSIATAALGGASVNYKLRAVAVRSGFSHNLQALVPVFIIRSFASEALEYQQTLEIENTWPEKLMYSIMIPHKAWAVGDKLTALVKFSPLAKGARVITVTTTVNESTKLYCRSGGHQEHTRVVASARHDFVAGRAIPAEEHHHGLRNTILHHGHSHLSYSVPVTPGHATPNSSSTTSSFVDGHLALSHISTRNSNESIPPISPSSPGAGPSSPPISDHPELADGLEPSEDDSTAYLTITVPLTATPSHTLEPIIVGHRIRWSILIANRDGHTSELRCSLPIHLLDYRLIDEARSATLATRRLLLGGAEGPTEEEDEMELPSYPAHVRDRVANMFLPETATMRVTNPWVHQGISPTLAQLRREGFTSSGRTPSGASSPLEAHPIMSSLPHVPGTAANTSLDWVNSELLLSLSDQAPPPLRTNAPSPPDSSPPSHPDSRRASRRPSRSPSRATSPERHNSVPPHSIASATTNGSDTYVHSASNASRSLTGIFQASMKPFSSLTGHGWLGGSRSVSHSNLSALGAVPESQRQRQEQHRESSRPIIAAPPPDTHTSSALLHRAFTEVPNYGVASRGFLGGVPPLESMRGLPSYEEAERSVSESDLAGRFAQALPSRNAVPASS